MAQKKQTNIDISGTTIKRWADAGFKEHLLPIIPYDAEMSDRTSVTEEHRGKVPGLPVGDAWGGFPGWQNTVASDEHIEFWARLEVEKGAGVGLQARSFPAIDIDVMDAPFSDTLAMLSDVMLGPAPERIGRAPKRLLAYALEPGAEPIRKHRVEFTLPATGETKHAVEVLGAGQQFVVAGVHPGTAQPYAWTNQSPADRTATALTRITLEKVERFLDEVARVIVTCGGEVLSRSAAGEGAEPQAQAVLRGHPDMIKAALAAAGNDFDYDGWIRMVAAIKAALGADEAHYQIYEDWCLAYPGNTAQMARSKWDSVKPPYRVGANYIYEQAEARGWRGRVQAAFTPVVIPDDDVSTDPSVPHYIREWVYAVGQERFVRLGDRYALSERQFSRYMTSPGIGPDHKTNPVKLFFTHPRRRIVNSLTYVPGGPALVNVDGDECVNTWSPSALDTAARVRSATITDADVKPWLDHMAKLIPDPIARTTVLDWMAYVVQQPDQKPNWAVFLGGTQGIGKDLALVPLIRAVGSRNTRTIQPGELTSEYTDWVANRRLVVVEEMRNFETKSVMNKLKMYITRPPEMIPVHQKYLPIYETPNVAAFVFMSNFKDALSLEKEDRRYFVYWSPMKPEPAKYYDALARFIFGSGGDEVAAWLHARNIASFDAQGRAPDSLDKTMMQESGLSDFEQAIVEMCEAGAAPFDAPVSSANVLYAALPMDIRRLPGGGLKRLTAAIQIAGGGPVVDASGRPRRIKLDAQGERTAHGTSRLWAVRDPEGISQLSDDMIRDLFRKSWVAGASSNDVFTPV
jgi:hypothetical protein